MKLTFLGATQTVTGSKYLLNCENQSLLIDCGLFQGIKDLRLRNWQDLPIDIKKLNAVVLSHAHIDHSGYLPILVRQGYHQAIYATHGTKDLCSILLPDSGRIQEEEAAFANKHGFSKHFPALPLYTEEEAENTLRQFHCRSFDQPFSPIENLTVTFKHAGHIIGAASVFCQTNNTSIIFSGDLGRPNDALMHPPEELEGADYLVLESTYGNRQHIKSHPAETLEKIVNDTIKRGGTLIIPAFAVGRAQSILYYLYLLKKANKIADIPVFVDSPMATNATHLLCQYANEHYLNHDTCREVAGIATYINTPEESKQLDKTTKPIIIISASGMLTGGRVLHHIKHFGPDPKNTILFAGYQAEETRGRALLEGQQKIKIHGQKIHIRAKIEVLHNVSAHADNEEILEWLSYFKKHPRKVFITHGEQSSSYHLKSKIESQLGWPCVVPEYLQVEDII